MDCGNVFFCAVGFGLLFLIDNSCAQYYQYADLENSCNGSLLLDCPYHETGKAGTFRYYYITWMQPGLCFFNVTLVPSCGTDPDLFAFYFNIRKLDLPSGDYIKIHQTTSNGQQFLLKHLTGSQNPFSNPSSVAQTMTFPYEKRPKISFEYFRSSSPVSSAHDAVIDFVIVENNAYSHNTRCEAFSGYVNNIFICDTDGSMDRVNCPSGSNPVFGLGFNPALGRQCTDQPPTSAWIWNTTNILPNATSAPVRTTTFQPPVTAAPGDVPLYLLTPLNITCRLGRVTLPEPDLDLADSLTTVFDGDNTLNCRVILHDLHSWIVAKTGETRQKRASFYEPIKVECARGNLTVSNVDPGTSESTGLVFRTGASKKCMETYRDFLTYVTGFLQNLS
ncbi:uncharacterized protein LOC129596525 [Paramacrobiotus metropolitanus]|uniref:uncharacterized protein LOC129596525 n=1 Tax=Paramacrobiotus metropolitanus TaxID=2943436 RepID=UPI00244603A8|nr:uncharacterized protein LOC129596525 [Paramacrobiotus metropolitanus]